MKLRRTGIRHLLATAEVSWRQPRQMAAAGTVTALEVGCVIPSKRWNEPPDSFERHWEPNSEQGSYRRWVIR